MRILTLLFFAVLFNVPIHDMNNMSKPDPLIQNDNPLFSFGLIADAQYCDCPAAGTRYYRLSYDKLNEAVKVFKKDQVSFIIDLGDLIDNNFESYKPVLEVLNTSGLKTFHCTGNHDYSVDPGLKNQLPVLSHSKTGYYSFRINNFRLVFLNGNEISTYASADKDVIDQSASYIRKLKDEGAVNAIDWNGGIGKTQLLWFENQLREAQGKHERVIIFCHFPVAPENIHNLLNYKEILPYVEKYKCIVAWFSGHNHAGNYADYRGVHFITMKGMVETETVNNFSTVGVYPDKLVIKGYGNEKDQTLQIN